MGPFLGSLAIGIGKDIIKNKATGAGKPPPPQYTGQIQNDPLNFGNSANDYLLRKLAKNEASNNLRMRGGQY